MGDPTVGAGFPVDPDTDIVMGDPRVDIGLAVLDPLTLDSLAPLGELRPLVGE